MFTAKNYVIPVTLEEAWALNQNKSNKIAGGMLWMKMSRKNISNIIDLSALNLDFIEENEKEFRIGAMCNLRKLEQHKGIELAFGDIVRRSLESIVGVQFRNLATIGGSIYSRFGFSDILTALMALDTYVELYKGGIMPLSHYAQMPYDRDILMHIIIKKHGGQAAYESFRNTATDLPVLTCAVSKAQSGAWKIIYGARPGKAMEFENNLPVNPKTEDVEAVAEEVLSWGHFNGNMRAGGEYRSLLGAVLLKRAIFQITERAEV